MVGAHHARHAHHVICTHLMLTPTPSLPLPAVPLCMCRHGSAAVMPCGCDCTHWRCRWLPLPSHLLLPLLSLFYFSIAASSGVCGCWWRGRRGCVFHTATPPASCQQLLAGGCLFVLVAEGEEGVSHSQAVRVAVPPSFPMLCCVVCWYHHGTCCSHPATPRPHQSWHRGLTASPLLSPLCDSTHRSSSGRGHTARQASTR